MLCFMCEMQMLFVLNQMAHILTTVIKLVVRSPVALDT
jgi:hypothetical protein